MPCRRRAEGYVANSMAGSGLLAHGIDVARASLQRIRSCLGRAIASRAQTQMPEPVFARPAPAIDFRRLPNSETLVASPTATATTAARAATATATAAAPTVAAASTATAAIAAQAGRPSDGLRSRSDCGRRGWCRSALPSPCRPHRRRSSRRKQSRAADRYRDR